MAPDEPGWPCVAIRKRAKSDEFGSSRLARPVDVCPGTLRLE